MGIASPLFDWLQRNSINKTTTSSPLCTRPALRPSSGAIELELEPGKRRRASPAAPHSCLTSSTSLLDPLPPFPHLLFSP